MEAIEGAIKKLCSDSQRYSKEEKPAVQDVAPAVAPTMALGSAMFAFRPLNELSPGEITELISPQQFEDWIEAYDDYLLTGVREGVGFPTI